MLIHGIDELLPHRHVHNATKAKCRNDPAHARKRAHAPFRPYLGESLAEWHVLAVVNVQAQQMQWCTEYLYGGWGEKLCSASTAYVLLNYREDIRRQFRRDKRREIKGSEDCKAVADCEQGVGR